MRSGIARVYGLGDDGGAGRSTDEAAVADAVRGSNAVLVALSPKIVGGPRDLPLASGTGNILDAMRGGDPGSRPDVEDMDAAARLATGCCRRPAGATRARWA